MDSEKFVFAGRVSPEGLAGQLKAVFGVDFDYVDVAYDGQKTEVTVYGVGLVRDDLNAVLGAHDAASAEAEVDQGRKDVWAGLPAEDKDELLRRLVERFGGEWLTALLPK